MPKRRLGEISADEDAEQVQRQHVNVGAGSASGEPTSTLQDQCGSPPGNTTGASVATHTEDEGISATADALDAVSQLTSLLQAKSQEVERMRTHLESLEQIAECCICLERPVSHAFIPCGHLFCCASKCDSAQLQVCPVCRGPVREKTRLYGIVDAFNKHTGLGPEESTAGSTWRYPVSPGTPSSFGANSVLAKVCGAFVQFERRLKTKTRDESTGGAQRHEMELGTQRSISAMESQLTALETLLAGVERELVLQQVLRACSHWY
jgi:hypothetical protein